MGTCGSLVPTGVGQMSYWKPLIVRGQHVDLAHLEPFHFSITPKDWKTPATIRVRFNNHCFSEDYASEKHSESLPSSHFGKERRGFAPDRYELSLQLPRIITNLEGKRVFQTREGNLAHLETTDGRAYCIFFTLKKTSSSYCDMFVVSAYSPDKPSNVADTGEMKFIVAVALVLKGKKPKFPPRASKQKRSRKAPF